MAGRKKVLIGYDGSTYADCALDDLQRAGLPRHVEAVVLTVSEVWLPGGVRQQVSPSQPSAPAAAGAKEAPAALIDLSETDGLEKALTLALRAKARLESYFTAWEVRAEARCGSPAREILNKANEWGCDLIVVGCQGCSGLGRFLLGSVSQKVVSEAHCSVRVTRGTAWKSGSPVRIVIGIDGSTSSQVAVSAVASRSWPMGSEVRLVAVEDQHAAVGLGPAPRQEAKSWIQGVIETAARQLRSAELTVSSKVEVGDPKQILVTETEEWGADCIFLGSSGSRNQLQSIVLGSVATAVVARAHCSAEILRTHAAGAARG